MFRMHFQTVHKPVHQPPKTNIQVRPATLAIANPVVFGNIFSQMISSGPCSSCGNSK
jgi:hypothetical protein